MGAWSRKDIDQLRAYEYWTGVSWGPDYSAMEHWDVVPRDESVESPGRAPAQGGLVGAKWGISTEELSRCAPKWAAHIGRVWSTGPAPYDWMSDPEFEKF